MDYNGVTMVCPNCFTTWKWSLYGTDCPECSKNQFGNAEESNPCNEIELGKTEECVLSHPTARVKQKYYLLIG